MGIFRTAYHVNAMIATAATMAQIGTLKVITFKAICDTTSQTTLVARAKAPHQCVKELTIRPPITMAGTAAIAAQVCRNMLFFIFFDRDGEILGTLRTLHLLRG